MAWTGYASGLDPNGQYYAKPRPLNTGAWTSDVINGTNNGTTGEVEFGDGSSTLADSTDYAVYRYLAFPTAAQTDTFEGDLNRPAQADLTDLQTEVEKIPRAASVLAAGSEAVRTITDNSLGQAAIGETITPPTP